MSRVLVSNVCWCHYFFSIFLSHIVFVFVDTQSFVFTVDHLFTNIIQNGFALGLVSDRYWKSPGGLDERYHHFSGNYHNLDVGKPPFKFEFNASKVEMEMKLAPPRTLNDTSTTHFNKEEYAKRLIGNAFSIPVVQIFLRFLQPLYSHQEYAQYDYDFSWHNNNAG